MNGKQAVVTTWDLKRQRYTVKLSEEDVGINVRPRNLEKVTRPETEQEMLRRMAKDFGSTFEFVFPRSGRPD